MMEPLVFFVTYGNGHIAKVAPVVHALRERGVRTKVMALTLGYRQARRLGLDPVGYKDFLHLVDAERAQAYGNRLLPGNSHPDVDDAESVAYLGINYLDWVDRYGEEGARQRYEAGGRRSFMPLGFIGRVIDEIGPSLVVSTASPRSEQAAIEVGVAHGIPTMTMMDLFALPHDNFRRNTVFADRITLLSEFARDNLMEAGVNGARLVVTGCPAYDKLFEPEPAQAAREWTRAMGWEGLHTVMWAGNLEEAAPNVPPEYLGAGLGRLVEQRLRQWVAADPGAALVVRYHPNQYHLFDQLGPQERVYVSNPTQDPLHPQLYACDSIVTQTSTVGFEGALIGKRLLALSFSPWVINFDFDYGKLGLGESVPSLDALVPRLRTRPPRRDNMRAFPPPGAATPRVLAQMLELMGLAQQPLSSMSST
ncbi:MAG: hypothetical protein QE495_06075 [Acidovorax sp.]|uniref:hypothetical protein n=1 Tax=Acidovorax sp. TaxID=1872122 RepID=UPI002618F95E|nr:hypothetical protein [Acidovorax sp.]MDH4426000.1 hypothetical protein [Acidovorax sp.]